MSTESPPVLFAPAASLCRGCTLRPAAEPDRAFERLLFETARPDAALLAAWPDAIRQPFLDQQFHFQSIHYARVYPRADWLLILNGGERIGRMILDRGADEWCLVDIALMPAWRGKGIGADLLQQVLADAIRARAPCLRLSVEANNRARRLYERLGFAAETTDAPMIGMIWRPPSL